MHTAALFALLPFLGSALAAPLNKRDTGVFIYSGRDNKCLSLPAGQSAGDGTPVVSVDCNVTGVSQWDINRGSGSVVLSGTDYALDIGLSPGNNGALKVWTSYPTAAQQTWYYTDDNRIAQTGGTQCLDEGDNGIQTYECTTGNTNQVFYTRGSTTPATSSSSAAPPPASSSAAPPPPTNQGSVILANNYVNLCLTVQDNDFANGTPVDVANCMNPSFSASERAGQIWDVTPGSTGAIKVLGTDYCLDAGSNPEDGSGMKIWQCYDGLLQQTWNVAPDGGLIALSNNQCLDVTKEDQPSPGYIYGNSNPVQTWTCSGDDQQQQFSVRASNSAF